MQTLIEEFEKATGKKLDVKKEFGDIEGEELRAALHIKREELADKERTDLQRKIKCVARLPFPLFFFPPFAPHRLPSSMMISYALTQLADFPC